MKRFLLILVFSGAIALQAQTYSPTGTSWRYTPKQQTDSMQILRFLKFMGEPIKFTAPADGQILKRVSGIWRNSDPISLSYDSLRFYKSNGMLKLWKDGSVALSDTLDGRYALISTLLDSLSHVRSAIPTGVMLKSEYDPSGGSTGQIVNTSEVQTLLNKTLATPTITDFSLAQHNHSSASQGGLVNSDVITQGSSHLFSPFTYSSGNYTLTTGNIGLGGSPIGYKLDVFGSARIQQLTVSTNLTFGGITLSGIQTGTGTNLYLATKNYVDDQIITSGGYNNEQAQDAVGGILDNGTVGGVIFTYNDAGNAISADVKNDSHLHTGSTISGLSVSNFTSPNISAWTNDANYIGASFGLTGALGGTLSAPTIANNAVTLPKIQQVSTSTFLGRISAGTGNVESLTVANVQGMLSLGSMAYETKTNYSLSTHNHDASYQPLDGDLTSIAGLTGTTGLLRKTATNTWELDNTAYVTGTPWTTMGYLTSASLSGYQTALSGNGFVKVTGTSVYYDNSSYALDTHTHTGVYEVPLTFSTGLTRTGNTITNNITQYTDALARGSVSLTTTGTSGSATYNSTTGVLNIPNYSFSMTYPPSGIAVSTGTAWGTSIDPSTLVTNSSLSTTLGGYVTSSSLTGTLSSYATTSSVSGNYVPYSGASSDVNLGAYSITATNFTLSDRRLKENFKSIDPLRFNPVFYQFNLRADSTKKTHYGVIAQEVEQYAPELVRTDSNGTKSVNYIELLVAECVRLETLVKSLENRIKTLEDEK